MTVRDVRRVNRAAVLRPLFLSGPLNRVLLGEMTGLSSASVTNVVSDLLNEGLVIEAGTEESEGGRPRVLLKVNPAFGVAIGVDVGETGIRIEAFDLSMREIGRAVLVVHPQEHDPGTVIEHIAGAVTEMLARLDGSHRRVLGVGVGVPGVVEYDGESLVHAPNIGWNGVPLARMLSDAVALPTLVENGAKSQGQAEMWFGAGRGARYAIVALIGTGVGAAIFSDGSLYRGAASSAGEWGHTAIVAGGRPCRCGGQGCLEAYVGGPALIEQWAEVDKRIRVPASYDEEEWLDKLIAAGLANPVAAALLQQTAFYLGVAVANLVNLFNPQRIVVGGWAGLKLGRSLLPQVRQALTSQALAYPASRVSVELGQLGPDAVALGASTLVIDQLLADGGALNGVRHAASLQVRHTS
ncbi:MAG: ROK family protein [Acidimicrobiales bacterium]